MSRGGGRDMSEEPLKVRGDGHGTPEKPEDTHVSGHADSLEQTSIRLGLERLEPLDLLRVSAAAIRELQQRGIVRTRNNPLGDYTEWLVAEKLGLSLEGNSSSGYDAISSDGTRYQIKGRRITPENPSVMLSAIRGLDADPFDAVIAVMFDEEFAVMYAAKVPREVIAESASYSKHVNAHRFFFRTSVLSDPRVEDITALLRS
jgi:hypothetical protein